MREAEIDHAPLQLCPDDTGLHAFLSTPDAMEH